MIPKELIKKIRQIEIYTSRAVDASFSGQYESVFKGRGMQFEEVREYIPGDDIRSIDWNVTARTGRAHIKRFVEEREMTLLFMVDLSASGDFGTIGKTKNELAAEFCAVLSFAALRNNDKVGLIIFTDRIELYIPPKKGLRHILRLIRELLSLRIPHRKTGISIALDYAAKVMTKKATIFLVSDFLETGFKRQLNLLNRRHDCVAVTVRDKAEISLCDAGIIELADAETGEMLTVDTSSKLFRRTYNQKTADRDEKLKQIFRSIGVDTIDIQTDGDYIHNLIRFFHMRHRKY
jgi:uncharacterized protein (DUF58 family)